MNSAAFSVVVIAKNEARNIGRCLESITLSDDVVVVDDNSADETTQIAVDHGARVLVHPFASFAQQRNWALDHADLKHPWVLMLDADEALTPAFERDVASALSSAASEVAGLLLCRKTMFLNGWLRFSDGFPVWIMRLVRRNRARFVDSGHGELPAPPVDGVLRRIKEPFLHYPFSRGLDHWVARHNDYSTREAALEARSQLPWSWREILCGSGPARRRALRNFARKLPFRPSLRFFHHYFWKRGFLDGRAGLEFCRLMAWYERMIVLKRLEGQAENVEPHGSGGPIKCSRPSAESLPQKIDEAASLKLSNNSDSRL